MVFCIFKQITCDKSCVEPAVYVSTTISGFNFYGKKHFGGFNDLFQLNQFRTLLYTIKFFPLF